MNCCLSNYWAIIGKYEINWIIFSLIEPTIIHQASIAPPNVSYRESKNKSTKHKISLMLMAERSWSAFRGIIAKHQAQCRCFWPSKLIPYYCFWYGRLCAGKQKITMSRKLSRCCKQTPEPRRAKLSRSHRDKRQENCRYFRSEPMQFISWWRLLEERRVGEGR